MDLIFNLLLKPLIFLSVAASSSTIRTLPGFSGDLPFTLETGYIGVGELEEVRLFYYFVESERSPRDDPLLLWLTGGPGCSGFSALVYEIGPLEFDYAKSRGKRPIFKVNPYSWTKMASIIFLDQPVGAGFSYATTPKAYQASDTSTAKQSSEFLRKWLMEHPNFLTNPLFIGGDSYAGIQVPVIVQEISDGLQLGLQPNINLVGYILGNPGTSRSKDPNSRIDYAFGHALISEDLYEATKRDCKGEYTTPNTSNLACMSHLQAVTTCIEKLHGENILEHGCAKHSLNPINYLSNEREKAFPDDSSLEVIPCPALKYTLCHIWSNDKTVQRALHIREGTKQEWLRCNTSMSFTEDIWSSFDYHLNLTKRNFRVLVYSGDQDMVVPYVGTLQWIKALGLNVSNAWSPWFVDGQVAGYTMTYSAGNSELRSLVYATVKGAGHTAPEDKPRECFAMVDRWLSMDPL